MGTRSLPSCRRTLWGLLALGLPLATAAAATLAPQHVEFDPAFIDRSGPGSQVDLSSFADGNRVLPGQSFADIYLNNALLLSRMVTFERSNASFDAQACLTRDDVERFGLKPEYATAFANGGHDDCVDLSAVIPEARVQYDPTQQRLDVSVPQVYLDIKARGLVSPKRWDTGINSAQVDYRLNASHQNNGSKQDNQVYGGVNSGLNLGGWRVRNQSNLAQNAQGRNRLQSLQTWVSHDVDALHSQLRIGDSTTRGLFDDAIPFRGAQLWYDNDMTPDSETGYAPLIRGVANSNAKVTISQNGNVIDTRYVSPGPFEISDLYQSGSGGDLTVTVTEADGSKHSFVQPYASLPVMLRPGSWDYSASAGQLRDGSLALHPNFARFSVAHGFGDGTTLYGGMTSASNYQSWMLGASRTLGPIGALALDANVARAQQDNGSREGQALRLQYSKSLPAIGSQIQLSATHYNSPDYLTFADATRLQQGRNQSSHALKSKGQLTLSQDLGRFGSLSLSATRNRYWNNQPDDTLLNVSYNTQIGRASLSLYALYSANNQSEAQRSFGATISMALDPVLNKAYANLQVSKDSSQLGVSGTALANDALSYNVAASLNQRQGSGNASLDYRARAAELSASVSNSGNSTQGTVGMAGSALLHSGGLTLGQPMNGAEILVHAPGAAGMPLADQPGVSIDGNGYALLSSARPYHENRVALDVSHEPDGVEIKHAVTHVVPRRDAVVAAEFEVAQGDKVIAQITRVDGQPVPFGSRVLDTSGKQLGLAGDDGMAYITGLQPDQRLQVTWGKNSAQRCMLHYVKPVGKSTMPFQKVDLGCSEERKPHEQG